MSIIRHLDMSICRQQDKKCTDVCILCLHLYMREKSNKTLNNKLYIKILIIKEREI